MTDVKIGDVIEPIKKYEAQTINPAALRTLLATPESAAFGFDLVNAGSWRVVPPEELEGQKNET